MTRTRIAQAWLFTAVLAAMAPSARLGAAPIGGDVGPLKDTACLAVGCTSGEKNCAEVLGEVSNPLVGKMSVKWFCYEPKPLEM